jgi:hypothetical protein
MVVESLAEGLHARGKVVRVESREHLEQAIAEPGVSAGMPRARVDLCLAAKERYDLTVPGSHLHRASRCMLRTTTSRS